MEVSPVELREWQVDWATKAAKILENNYGYIDTSMMRSGKTYVTLWIAQQFNIKLLIVCPIIAIDVWKNAAEEYGVEIVGTISYQSLRSTTDHQPKHGFLERIDEIVGKIKRTEFIVTEEYRSLLSDGILLVFDEIQNIKNNSSQYKACTSLIHTLLDVGGGSRFALLSGTPFDKEEHSVNLLKMIGYIKSRNLYRIDKDTKRVVLEGMQDLIEECMRIDPKTTQRILRETPPIKTQMEFLCYKLYVLVIKNEISGAMKAPIIESTFDIKNGFFSINKKSAEELKHAVALLGAAVGYNKAKETALITANKIGSTIIALMKIENAKAIDMARVADEALVSNNNLKVVISVNYTTTIEIISKILLKWNPLILNGEIKARKRGAIVKSFVKDQKHRVIIMNTTVGGVGISLYSQEKNQDRLTLMSPSYEMLKIIQAASRIFGPGMKSEAKVRLFYGKCADCDEKGILTALARKTLVLKGILDESTIENLKLPGDYEPVIET